MHELDEGAEGESERATHVELARTEPHVLVLGALVAALGDDLARGDLLAGDVLEPRGSDPPGRVLGVRLGERLEERARALDVAAGGTRRAVRQLGVLNGDLARRAVSQTERGSREDERRRTRSRCSS